MLQKRTRFILIPAMWVYIMATNTMNFHHFFYVSFVFSKKKQLTFTMWLGIPLFFAAVTPRFYLRNQEKSLRPDLCVYRVYSHLSCYMVVSTQLKDIGQIGSSPQVLVKTKLAGNYIVLFLIVRTNNPLMLMPPTSMVHPTSVH